MKKLPDEQKVKHELYDLEQVQLCLSGLEIYLLIVAVQMWKAAFGGGKLTETLISAELTAKKLHKELVPCPNVYTLLDQGWNLESKPDSLTETNDTIS